MTALSHPRKTARRRRFSAGLVLALLLAPGLLLAAAPRASALVDTEVPVGAAKAAELPGLHNVFHLSAKLYTGSAPEGDAGFRSLQRLGIRTVLTVDGMPPDVAAARRFGMRYVHLPFPYEGCPLPTATRIVRAVRDLPGPIYLHCHHGQHRAPTAAEFARITLDGITPEQAVAEMRRAGTGTEYVGLYDEVRRYRPPSKADLDRAPGDFPEVTPTPPLTSTMVKIDGRFSRLLAAQQEGWKSGGQQGPEYDALQLRELFTEAGRTGDVHHRPADFRRWLADAVRDTGALETALRAGNRREADRSIAPLAAACATCHGKYRNVPQPGGSERPPA